LWVYYVRLQPEHETTCDLDTDLLLCTPHIDYNTSRCLKRSKNVHLLFDIIHTCSVIVIVCYKFYSRESYFVPDLSCMYSVFYFYPSTVHDEKRTLHGHKQPSKIRINALQLYGT